MKSRERGLHPSARSSHAAGNVGWFRISSKRLDYRGRLSKQPFSAWARSPEGTAAIDVRVKRDGLRVFGRTRARRQMWRELAAVARDQSFRDAMQSKAKHFATAIIEASHAPGLPRRTIALHRLVVVPRTLVAGRMRAVLRRQLSSQGIATLDPHVREFFLEQLVAELDAAIATHRPSTSRPVLTHEAWACVGHHANYEWVDPIFSGAGWGGHLLMFEFPAQGLARRARKELEQSARDIQASLANISRQQRQALIQVAVDGLPRATA